VLIYSGKINNSKAVGGSFFKFMLTMFFGYSFYFGGYLRWNKFKNFSGELYNTEDILATLFLLLIGTVMAGGVSQHVPAISKSRVAGAMAFKTIDHVPSIKTNEKGTKVVKADDIKGKFEFENVCFNYPSNPDLKVLKNLSCTFEAGQSIGLVGPSGSGKSTIIQLLERFYDPTSGVVKIDGMDLKSLNLTSYR
jgi:ATP-binding cassette subfamily B (MDR/TAP) protein 1